MTATLMMDLNSWLEREDQVRELSECLRRFEQDKHNQMAKKGIYVYGSPGTGKTVFVKQLLQTLQYDVISYDAGDVRNASVMEDITKHSMSDVNVMSLFERKVRRIAILMDEMDGMNNGDKGGMSALIKLIRPKKTKKQKEQASISVPVICIASYKSDKKIKELMKVCHVVELLPPTLPQMQRLVAHAMPTLSESCRDSMARFMQGDLRKFFDWKRIHDAHPSFLSDPALHRILQTKCYNDDTKQVTHRLLQQSHPIDLHSRILNDTDRTSVGLLWHENVVDRIDAVFSRDKLGAIRAYRQQLDNICFADYIDRITFQKQIWQFNELSSLMKTFRNHTLFHQLKPPSHSPSCNSIIFPSASPSPLAPTIPCGSKRTRRAAVDGRPSSSSLSSSCATKTAAIAGAEVTALQHSSWDAATSKDREVVEAQVRFTKVLTKYSTEYNNHLFLQRLCQKMGRDKKDLIAYFGMLRHQPGDIPFAELENMEVSKLDVQRIFRYIEKYLTPHASGLTLTEACVDVLDVTDDGSADSDI